MDHTNMLQAMTYCQTLQEERFGALMKRLDEIHTDVRAQNGRVSGLERKVAVLEDRSPNRAAGIWGALGGILGGFGASWFKP